VERTIQDNVQRTLALELQKLSLDFRKQQKSYLMRLRERDGRKSTAASALGVLDDEGMLATDNFLSEMQSLQVDNSVALADERDREVVKIVGSIHDLGMVMKDLSVLVIEQGTVLDRIDCQLQETSSVVEQGVSQLRRAEKAQRRGILASCVLILCAMIAFLFVILIIKSIL
jgi:syntaxin 16